MGANQIRKEDARHEVLAFLAARQKLAFDAPAIHRRLARVSDFTLGELEEAAEFLASAGLATKAPDPLGATPYFQATSAGVLAQERSAA